MMRAAVKQCEGEGFTSCPSNRSPNQVFLNPVSIVPKRKRAIKEKAVGCEILQLRLSCVFWECVLLCLFIYCCEDPGLEQVVDGPGKIILI